MAACTGSTAVCFCSGIVLCSWACGPILAPPTPVLPPVDVDGAHEKGSSKSDSTL